MIAVIFDFNRTIYNSEEERLMDGAEDILRSLQLVPDLTLFLIAKGKEKRKAKIKSLNIEKYFKEVIVEPEKTVELFKHCQGQCVPETKFFVIGDRIKREIRNGNECGMTTIWFRNSKFKDEIPEEEIEQPDHTITDLIDVMPILRKAF